MNEDDIIISDNARPTTHDEIAAALGVAPPNRGRRLEAIARGWRKDAGVVRMAAMLSDDPTLFDATYGPRGRIVVGMYRAGEAAAAGRDPDEPDAA